MGDTGTTRLQQFLDNLTSEQMVERLNLALDGATLGIWDWDLRDNAVQFDRRWCEMLGLQVESTPMHLSTWESRVHPEDLDACYRDIQAYLRGETPFYENIHRMRHEDGRWVYILDRGRLSGWDDDGTPIRFTGTHFDCTEAEHGKKVLQESRRILGGMVEHLPTAAAMFDRDDRYMAASAEWLKLFGLEGCSIHGRTPGELESPLPATWDDAKRLAAKGQTVSSETDQVELGGERLFMRWAIRPWKTMEEESQGLIITCNDITKIVEDRQRIERDARLAELGLMAAGIAHELNTPLQSLTLAVEILEDTLTEGESLERDDLLEQSRIILSTTERISRIVTALRSVSRNRPADTPIPFDVAQLIEEQLDLFKESLSRSEITIDAPEIAPTWALGRRADTAQILLNLFTNAMAAVQEKDERWIRIRLTCSTDQVSVRVTDSGPQLDDGVVAHLMTPFFTTKAPGKGTGLGLSLSKSLAERMSGDLHFIRAAENTTFELTLPAAPGPAEAQA